MKWFVVNTQPHKETTAERHLREQGYRVFLPSFMRPRRHARRVDVVRKALFPGYLFVQLDVGRSAFSPINSTVGVRRLVTRGATPAAAPDALVSALIERADEEGVLRDPVLQPGQRVRFVRGPFADIIGAIYALADNDRVVVLLNMLGRDLKKTVYAHELAPAS